MKLQKVSYTNQFNSVQPNNNNTKNKQSTPSFGNLGVGLATFIESNGFLGEFLTIDTTGMMTPRTVQGYARNSKELGHPNYKAGREEMVRELLSGPAFFYVPLSILTLAGIIRGKSAKVTTDVLNGFQSVMKTTTKGLKDSKNLQNEFVDNLISESFKDYKNERGLVDKLAELMKKNLNKEGSAKKLREEATETLTTLNKANGKNLDAAGTMKMGEKNHSISSLFKDMKNYIDDFSKKAEKTTETKETFIDKFHKKAHDLRLATNIAAVAALSAFLAIIPKLYQTGKKFPGKDGLKGAEQTPESAPHNAKEAE